jgi:aminomuconate-semialdehyde dehydrogenase
MHDEIFGPVVCVTTFRDVDEVIERANNTKYGLAATIWTNDLKKAHYVSRQLQAGTTWINCFLVRDLNMPFGGVKESGMGSEGYPYSLDFYCDQKTTCIYYGE